jgi:2-keto-4-pentenoate hydratase/2-oxohepta-3-ene-1,7-dioic acid hydratase in catechol pathway
VNRPYDPTLFGAEISAQIDRDVELAVIIGKRGRNITASAAMSHVFGFTVINDTSPRALQTKKHGGQWLKGKSLDGHGPMGPWIIMAAEPDHDNLHLTTRVNGVAKQDADTKEDVLQGPRIIAELSAGLTLEPGDIIATSTPPGVGWRANRRCS